MLQVSGYYYYALIIYFSINIQLSLTYKTLLDRKKARGFPDYSYYEALSYPGKHGNPEACGTLPEYLTGVQPGLLYSNDINGTFKSLNLPFN